MGGCGIGAGQGNPPVKLGGCRGVRCPPRGERALLTVLPPPPPAPAALCTALPCPPAPNPQRTLNPFSPARRGWGGPGPPPPPRGSLAALQRPYRDPIWPTAGWDQPRLTQLRNGGRGVCQFWGPQSRHRGKPGVFWGHRGTPGLPSRKGTRDNPGGAPGYGHTRQLGRVSLLVWHESRGQVGAGRRLLICWPRLCTQSCCSGACPSHQGHEPTGPRATAAGSPKAGSPGAGSPGVGSPGAGSPPQCAPHSQHWDRPGPPSTE